MAKLSEVRDMVLRLLSDDGTQFDADLTLDAISAAHKAVLPWIFKQAKATLAGDGDITAFSLPSDCYRIVSVYDDDEGLFVPKGAMGPGTSPADNVNINNDWVEYPKGYLSFANAPAANIVLHYGAYWSEPATDETELEVPDCLLTPIVLYAASYSLLQKASSASNIRQWNVKIDSGTPVMNPMRDSSQYLLERFKIEMSTLPITDKGTQ